MFESSQFVILARIIVVGLCVVVAAIIGDLALVDLGFVPALLAIATIGIGLYASPMVLAAWTSTAGNGGGSPAGFDERLHPELGREGPRGTDGGLTPDEDPTSGADASASPETCGGVEAFEVQHLDRLVAERGRAGGTDATIAARKPR